MKTLHPFDQLAKQLAGGTLQRRDALRRLGGGFLTVLGLGATASRALAEHNVSLKLARGKNRNHVQSRPGFMCMNFCEGFGFRPSDPEFAECFSACARHVSGHDCDRLTGGGPVFMSNPDSEYDGYCGEGGDEYALNAGYFVCPDIPQESIDAFGGLKVPYCEEIPDAVNFCSEDTPDGTPCRYLEDGQTLFDLFGGTAFCYNLACEDGECVPHFTNIGGTNIGGGCVPDYDPPGDGQNYYGLCDGASQSCVWAACPEIVCDRD